MTDKATMRPWANKMGQSSMNMMSTMQDLKNAMDKMTSMMEDNQQQRRQNDSRELMVRMSDCLVPSLSFTLSFQSSANDLMDKLESYIELCNASSSGRRRAMVIKGRRRNMGGSSSPSSSSQQMFIPMISGSSTSFTGAFTPIGQNDSENGQGMMMMGGQSQQD